MSANRWSDSCIPLLTTELGKQSDGLDITWDILCVPVMGMGQNGRPVIGPAQAIVYLSIPSLLLGEPPLVITGVFPMFDLTEDKIEECVHDLVTALREGRSQMLNAAKQALAPTNGGPNLSKLVAGRP